ncbi:MAG: MFS transporter [Albidovulum sp.]|nr:MFS transporter [Albidovulum sp.]
MSRSEALLFINVAHFFDHFFLLIFPTAALAIAPAWNMSYADVLLLGSPIYLMFALGTLPAGWLGDRIDRMTLIAVCFLGCGASSLWIAMSDGPLAMTAGLGSLGLFAAIYHPVGLAHITQIGLRTGRALAINGIFGNMGLAGAAMVTGVLASYLGWQWAFLAPGGLAVLTGLLLLLRNGKQNRAARNLDDDGASGHPSFDRKTRITVFAVVCVLALFGGLTFNAVTVSLPKFFDERLADMNGGLAWIGASAGMVFAIAAFAQLPVGELLDRIGARPVLQTLLSAQALLLMLLTQASGLAALVLALFLVTFVFAGVPITAWLLGRYLVPGIRSRALSVQYVLSLGVGSGVVPLIAILHGRGIGFDVQFFGLAVAVSIILAASLLLPRREPAAGKILN